MISIQSYKQSSNSEMIANINNEDSLLIIGRGINENLLNEFTRPKNVYEMERNYGDSELTEAYKVAFASGARNIYVMNCHKTTDYIDSISFVSHYNFAYVVPIGVKLSDKFYSEEYEKEMYFAELYLNEFNKYTNSLLIFTDEHAELYQDIDHFLVSMHRIAENFREECKYILDGCGRNMAFCLNHIEDIKYSNVVMAAMLCATKVGYYPNSINKVAVFDLNSEDIFFDEVIYFKNNFHAGLTIENLKNFRTINDATKLITIDRVIKHIERTLDTSFVIGKLYNQYVKMNVHDYLDMFFRRLMGDVIRNYRINKVSFIEAQNLTGYIVSDIDIFPINSLEKINTLLEVM